jgi:hypothetical protein
MSYDPTVGAWTEADPDGYVDGPDRYQAFASNPANRVDPSGLASIQLSEDQFNYFAQSAGFNPAAGDYESNGVFDPIKATTWLQSQLGIKNPDGDFGSGSKLALVRRILNQVLEKCPCFKGLSADEKKQKMAKIISLAEVAFGEFGTSRKISADSFALYATAVDSSVLNRVGNPRFAGQNADVQTVIQKGGYDAYTQNSQAYQIATLAFSSPNQDNDKTWRALVNTFDMDGFIGLIKKLSISASVACDLISNPNKVIPKLVLYYSPDGMKNGGKPSWRFNELQQIQLGDVNPDLILGYGYK